MTKKNNMSENQNFKILLTISFNIRRKQNPTRYEIGFCLMKVRYDIFLISNAPVLHECVKGKDCYVYEIKYRIKDEK